MSLLSDRALRALVDEAPVVGSGVGGTSARLEIGDTPVFVKRVPLTDLERRPEHVMSTANLFGLPTWCQYGVGSPGFTVWREVAAHTMTTNGVLAGRCEAFPLLYHWRVLGERDPVPLDPEWADMDKVVDFWHGSPAMRARLEAIAESTADVVLFLEHVPQNLYEWLTPRLADGDDDRLAAACGMVERDLTAGVSFLASDGLLHFDAHFRNILTDGRRLYFSDFGLASSHRFELSDEEQTFARRNRTHDGCHAFTGLVNALVTGLGGVTGPAERNELVRRCAAGDGLDVLPPAAAAVVKRYAPVAVVMNDFYWRLHGESRQTPYPADEVERACAVAGLQLGSGR